MCRPGEWLVPACHWDLPNAAQEVTVTGLGQGMLGPCGLEMAEFSHTFGVFSPLPSPRILPAVVFLFLSPPSPSHGGNVSLCLCRQSSSQAESGAAPGQESVNAARRAAGGLLLPTPAGDGLDWGLCGRSPGAGPSACRLLPHPFLPRRGPHDPGGPGARRGRGDTGASRTPGEMEPPFPAGSPQGAVGGEGCFPQTLSSSAELAILLSRTSF